MSGRKFLSVCKRVVVQLGQSTTMNESGSLALGRVGNVVEQLIKLMKKDGKELFLVVNSPDNSIPFYEAMFAQHDIKTLKVDAKNLDIANKFRPNEIPICLMNNQNEEVEAAKLTKTVNADLFIMLSNVDGVFDGPCDDKHSAVIDKLLLSEEKHSDKICITDGMVSKVEAAREVTRANVPSIIANGFTPNIVDRIIAGEHVGTLCLDKKDKKESVTSPLDICQNAFKSLNDLRALTADNRSDLLRRIAKALSERQQEILEANSKDMEAAKVNNLDSHLLARLKLTPAKIEALVNGVTNLSNMKDPIGKVVSRREVTPGLELTEETVPLGILLVIFESRPDALPQVVSLALRSGNALILKGGKEAAISNRTLLNVINDAIAPELNPCTFQLVDTREAVSSLLKMDQYINLVIPRGSNDLVKSIQMNTKIPVMGHADGICHVYIDEHAAYDKAIEIVVDSKTDYPAACNAMETLLIHENFLKNGKGEELIKELVNKGVHLYGGPRAAKQLGIQPAFSLSHEYGSLEALVEIVSDVGSAIKWIADHGSSHTEVIVTENFQVADYFLGNTDSACVFHNVSSRFADGFRFGLGAEVGISTGRLHARGPVGVEGLLTKKWVMRTSKVFTVNQQAKGRWKYTHHLLL